MNWKLKYRKAVTFSYDDGNEQDIRLAELFRIYGLKATFHVNTGLDSNNGAWKYGDLWVRRLNLQNCSEVYRGHEVSVHGSMHRNLTELNREELRAEIRNDISEITRIFGERPVGLSYAYGAYNDMVLEEVRAARLYYGRGTQSTHQFAEQADLLQFQPTCHHDDPQLFDLATQFLEMKPEQPQIFYIWGHSYELKGKQHWERMERFFEKISGRSDIFYGTSREIFCDDVVADDLVYID